MHKIALLFTIIALLFFSSELFAQCGFIPTITPPNPTLCPNTRDTLWTQLYDGYQWYKGNKPIAGATNQFIVVSYQKDVGKKFKVAATKNGCTAVSRSVLVDGYVFVSPYIILSGDLGYYDPKFDARVLQPGDTLILTYSFSENVTWYNSGVPIEGATNQTYYVTSMGRYTVCAGPFECPNYILCLGLPVNVIFKNSLSPLTSLPDGFVYGKEGEGEERESETGAIAANVSLVYNPLAENILITSNHGMTQCVLTNMLGEQLAIVNSSEATALNMPVRNLPEGLYLLTLKGEGWQQTKKIFIGKN